MERIPGSTWRINRHNTNSIDKCVTYQIRAYHHKEIEARNQQLTYMLREFDAFHRNVKGGCIFVSGVLSPPLNHLNGSRLSLRSQRRTEELKTKFTVDIQNTVCAHQLKDSGKIKIKQWCHMNSFNYYRVENKYSDNLEERPGDLSESSLVLVNINIGSRVFHRYEIQDL